MSQTEEKFLKKLGALKNTENSIRSLSLWMIYHKKKAQSLVNEWKIAAKRCERSKDFLKLMYLANDVIQNCRKKTEAYSREFKIVLPEVVGLGLMVCEKKDIERIGRVFNIWKDRKIYKKEYILSLENIISGTTTQNAELHNPLRYVQETNMGEERDPNPFFSSPSSMNQFSDDVRDTSDDWTIGEEHLAPSKPTPTSQSRWTFDVSTEQKIMHNATTNKIEEKRFQHPLIDSLQKFMEDHPDFDSEQKDDHLMSEKTEIEKLEKTKCPQIDDFDINELKKLQKRFLETEKKLENLRTVFEKETNNLLEYEEFMKEKYEKIKDNREKMENAKKQVTTKFEEVRNFLTQVEITMNTKEIDDISHLDWIGEATEEENHEIETNDTLIGNKRERTMNFGMPMNEFEPFSKKLKQDAQDTIPMDDIDDILGGNQDDDLDKLLK